MFLKNSSPGPASDILDLSAPQCKHYSPDVCKTHTLIFFKFLSNDTFWHFCPSSSIYFKFYIPFPSTIPILLILLRSCPFSPDIRFWCWERLKAKRRRGRQRLKWLDSIIGSMDMDLRKLWETGEDLGVWNAAVHGVIYRVSQSLDNNCNPLLLLKFIAPLSSPECNNTGQKDFSVLLTAVFQSIEQFLACNWHWINISKINYWVITFII